MYRFRLAVLTAVLAGATAGCSEDQPNAPAKPSEAGPEFAKKSMDMMKEANKDMAPSKK